MSFVVRMGTFTRLVLLAAIGFALLLAGQSLFRHARIDLTQDRIFTLSEGTRTILERLEQPVELLFFYSEVSMREAPSLRQYALHVEDFLRELELRAQGKISLRVIDPEPFSEQEDRAADLGVQPVPLQAGGSPLYLGLAAVGVRADAEVISFLHPERGPYLEYDVVKAIYLASLQAAPQVGLISGLPVGGGFDMATRSLHKPWTAVQQLKQLYEVLELGSNPDEIAANIDLLVVVHPARLGEQALYAIDQFVLGGGKAMIFVDPYAQNAESIAPGGRLSTNSATASNMPGLFRAWGIEMVADKVVGDASHAMLVNLADDRAPVRDLTLLGVGVDGIARDAPVTRDLETLNLSTAGAFRALEGADTHWQPLLQTSRATALVDVERVREAADPGRLFDGFVPDGKRYAMAGLLTGRASTAFPEGPLDVSAVPAAGQRSEGNIRVLLVADTDLLTDRLWVQVQSFFGQRILAPFADNGALLVNGVDFLSGSPELIAIRSRDTVERPFTRVHELQRLAEERYRETQEALNAQLGEAERQLTRLQQAQAGVKGAVLTMEQQAAVDRFVAQKLALRKALREVQYQFSRDIETLGTRLKVINIGLVPLLLSIMVLWRFALRRFRYRVQ